MEGSQGGITWKPSSAASIRGNLNCLPDRYGRKTYYGGADDRDDDVGAGSGDDDVGGVDEEDGGVSGGDDDDPHCVGGRGRGHLFWWAG